MFKNILVATDGSSSSRAAVRQAFELAKAQDGRVTVLSVAPSVAPLAGLSGASIDQLADELKRWSEHTAQEAAADAPEGLDVETRTRSGHIGEEIVSEIDSGGYDLVVLGSRGRGRLASELFGSANGYVHFHSTVPLLSISDGEPTGDATRAAELAGTAT